MTEPATEAIAQAARAFVEHHKRGGEPANYLALEAWHLEWDRLLEVLVGAVGEEG